MPIVLSQIVRKHDKGNGSLSVHEEHTDHLGKIHEHRYYCPLDYDVDTALINRVAAINISLIENENEEIFNKCLNGEDPAMINFNHVSESESVRARMKAFLTGEAIKVMHMLLWVQSFTTPQLNTLGFTAEERGQINARAGTVDSVKSLLETDNLFILEDF